MSQAAVPAEAPPVAIGSRLARGAAWTVVLSAFTKVITILTQLALARFLSPAEIGVVALSFSIVGIISIFLGSNLQKLIVQSGENANAIASEIFWISLTLNIGAAVILALAAPALALAFDEPAIKTVLWIIAACIPMMGLSTVYAGKLYADLRFGTVANIQFVEGLLKNLGAVALALRGLGSLAIVIPHLASSCFAAIACRRSAGRILISRPSLAKAKPHFRATGWVLLQSLFATVQAHSAVLVLGSKNSSTAAGLYFWGYTLSAQAVFLLVSNLQSLLFPALARMNARIERQRSAFLDATQAICCAVVPMCVLQIFLADTLLQLFPSRWHDAAPVIRWLSFGMLTQPLSLLGIALLLARGSNRLVALLGFGSASVTVLAVWLGSAQGSHTDIAQWVGILTFLWNLVPGVLAFRSLNGTILSYAGHVLPAFLVCAPGALIGWLLASRLSHLSPIFVMALVGTMTLTIAYGLAWWRFPALQVTWRHFRAKRVGAASEE